MNHGQKSGLGSKARCQALARGATVDVCLGKLPVLFPATLTLDTSVPNLTVPSSHGFQMWPVAHQG